MYRFFIILSSLFLAQVAWASSDLIFSSRVATTLSQVNVYPDSSFEVQSTGSFNAGALVEVIAETELEYEDASQDQKFKWFKVKSLKGKVGWVFGDGLAVILQDKLVEPKLKSFHKKKYRFNSGFERSVVWIGGIQGRDNFHKKDYLNPLYKEYYIVITNERGQCVFVHHSNENARGSMQLRQILFCDTTGDEVPEILLQTSSFAVDDDFENRMFEIFSFRSGNLNRIFEERMSLRGNHQGHSPALFKYVEVDGSVVRVAYVDYLSCTNYSLPYDYADFDQKKEECLEYITYTYSWSERTKAYRMIYKESRTAPAAGSRKNLLVVKNEPSLMGRQVSTVGRSDRLEIIKQHNRLVEEDGKEFSKPYFYVRLKDGTRGYIEASDVGFIDIEHAKLLNDYYRSKSPDLKEWKKTEKFLTVLGDNRSSFTEVIDRK